MELLFLLFIVFMILFVPFIVATVFITSYMARRSAYMTKLEKQILENEKKL